VYKERSSVFGSRPLDEASRDRWPLSEALSVQDGVASCRTLTKLKHMTRPIPIRLDARQQTTCWLLMALVWVGSACCPPPARPDVVTEAPQVVPIPLGTLHSLSLSGSPRRAVIDGIGVELVIEAQLDAVTEHPLTLVAQLVRDDETLAEGRGTAAWNSGTVRETLTSVGTLSPGPAQLQLFMVREGESRPATNLLVVDLTLEVDEQPLDEHDSASLTRTFALDFEPERGVVCEDGRIVLAGAGGVAVLEDRQPTGLHQVLFADSTVVLTGFVVDWRCSAAILSAGDRLLAVDLLSYEVAADLQVEELLTVVRDANPRYVLLLHSNGGLTRFFLRDENWSQYSGMLNSPPRLFSAPPAAQAQPLVRHDDARLLIAVESGLCTLEDKKKVLAHCIELDGDTTDIALLPYGLGDSGYVPFDAARAAERFLDDEERLPAGGGRGTAMVLRDPNTLELIDLDTGESKLRQPLDVALERLHRRGDTVLGLGAAGVFELDLLHGGSAATPLAPPLEPGWQHSDSGDFRLLTQSDCLTIADRTGELRGFLPEPSEAWWPLWDESHARLVVVSGRAVVALSLDGLSTFRPE